MRRDLKTRSRFAIALCTAALAFAGVSGTARAQAMDPDAERARQLILRIRSAMKEIDALLLEGAAPENAEAAIAANRKRIEELLDQTEQKSKAVVQNIEELIKLGKPQQSGGQGQQPPPDSKDKQNQQGKDQSGKPRDKSQERDELPQQPEQDGKQPQDPQQKEDPQPKGDPKDGKADPSEGEQRDADRPPPLGATGEFERTDLSGRWGMLPSKEAEDLQRRSADEFPQRYRPWMELYFRRMSRLPRR